MSNALSVGLLIFPGFPMACLTSLIEPLRAANEISNEAAFSWQLLSETPDRVLASAGVSFEPDATLEDARAPDYLVLLSAPGERFRQAKTPGLLRNLHRHGTQLGAVSGAVFPLVRAGIGTNQRLAVHWCYKTAFEVEFPEVSASDRVMEIAPSVVTAAGAAAAFDLALHMIETRKDAALATEVACWFQHPMMRGGSVRQTVPGLDLAQSGDALPPTVAEAVRLLSENMQAPPSVAAIAAHLGVSPRHVERLFKQATGKSPSHYFRHLRMEAARQIVLYSNDHLREVAGSVGYGSVQVFSKHYRDAFGLTPQADRKRINNFRVSENAPIPSV